MEGRPATRKGLRGKVSQARPGTEGEAAGHGENQSDRQGAREAGG